MAMISIEGSVPVHPTEDPDKVRACIENIFPSSDIVMEDALISFACTSAGEFAYKLEQERIRDTAVMVLERNRAEDSTRFYLNKQAAFAGKVNFTDGDSTLGDILVIVRSGAQALIQSIRPVGV